jgi:POT family proton-dependent oligopeptide transporter
VGDQFGKTNAHLIEKVFMAFYFSINLGAGASLALTPWLLDQEWGGPWIAFGLPGILMTLATIVFWMGRTKFVHIPPGGVAFLKETLSKTGLKAIGKLSVLYIFVAMFWALFDQTGSTWVLQAQRMDRLVFGIELLPSQLQAVNPVMVMILIPLCAFVLYPAMNKVFDLTPVRKIGIGLFITIGAFAIPAWIEGEIIAGNSPNILWQGAAYLVITLAEVFVSITALEFSYTQAPKKMKSIIMGIFLLSVSLGNQVVSQVNFFIQDQEIIATVPPEGETVVMPTGKTRYELECTGQWESWAAKAGPDRPSATASTVVTIDRTVAKKDGKQTKKERPRIKIASFTADGREKWITVGKQTPVTLAWDAPGAANCQLGPPGVKVNAKGSREVVAERTTTYLLTCRDADRTQKAEKKLQIKVQPNVAVTDLTANGKAGASVREGTPVTLAWKSRNAQQCTITAHTVALEGPNYYWFWALMMLLTALLFMPVMMLYKPRTYIQGDDE